MTRPGRLGCALLSLASAVPLAVALGGQEARPDPAAAAAAAEEGLTARPDPAADPDKDPRLRVQRLAAELALTAGSGAAVPREELRRKAEELRAATGAYLAELEAEGPGPPAVLEGRAAARPIAPKRSERAGQGGPAPEADPADLQARQEALAGTHLAPSPEELRARIGGGESSRESPIGQLSDQLEDLERLLSRQAAADASTLSSIAARIREFAMRIPTDKP